MTFAERKELLARKFIFSKKGLRNEGEMKVFSDEGKLRELAASRSVVKELLKEVEQFPLKGNDTRKKNSTSGILGKRNGKYHGT